MADGVAVDLALSAAQAVIGQLVEQLKCVVYCKAEAQKLQAVLNNCLRCGGIADMVLCLSPSTQTRFAEEFWGFLHAVEDARVVINSTLRLQWYQLIQRYHHSKQLQSLRNKVAEYTKPDFLIHLQTARDIEQSKAGAGLRMGKLHSGEQHDAVEAISRVFQHTEELIPMLESQLAGANGKRNLALCGMPGLGKTTIARKMFEDLRLRPGFDAALFMLVSKAPDCRQLVNRACEELLGITEFPYESPEEGRDYLMRELQGRKVLLVLDDIWNANDLGVLNFATRPAREFPGPLRPLLRHEESRLLVTTRDRTVLTDIIAQGSTAIEEPPLLKAPHDGQLLFHHAFGRHEEQVPEEWYSVVQDVLHECKGNPLALSVHRRGP
eukprot:jgi/Botrbrau1/16042/Bobra.7_2s0016.1